MVCKPADGLWLNRRPRPTVVFIQTIFGELRTVFTVSHRPRAVQFSVPILHDVLTLVIPIKHKVCNISISLSLRHNFVRKIAQASSSPTKAGCLSL